MFILAKNYNDETWFALNVNQKNNLREKNVQMNYHSGRLT